MNSSAFTCENLYKKITDEVALYLSNIKSFMKILSLSYKILTLFHTFIYILPIRNKTWKTLWVGLMCQGFANV